ncbi:hypothetical protein [Deinococcus radiotolerans]|uniref:MarR family transcriptional regulator n=1 Tax=Deinococcus radiotolerans TaxID=1309407 RepID=A0ABQ2FP77_9DEIO|nr:hypothetical protein [Deinococcus radiotolerans]GGL13120.1 hypothetical protein GCM10010844_34900 [Deinococcus radiotolerans]
MSTKTSSITHPPRTRLNLLREDYLHIADGDYCAARLLNIFERWHNTKLDHRTQARHANAVARSGGERPEQDEGLWVYMSNEDLRKELMLEYSEKPVTRALTLLETKGFLRRRSNPIRKWDRKPQYLFVASAVQDAINTWAATRSEEPENSLQDESVIPAQSTPHFDGMDSAEVRTALRQSAESTPHNGGNESAQPQNGTRTLTGSTPSNSASNTTGFNSQVSSSGFEQEESAHPSSSTLKREEKQARDTNTGATSASLVARVSSEHPVEQGPGAARALLEQHLGGPVALANLLIEVPASGVDRRQWLTIPEDRIRTLMDEARSQEELMYRTYLIRALDVEIGSSLSLPNRAPRDTPVKEARGALLDDLHEGDLIRSRKTGNTFRVVSVTRDGVDVEMPGFDRPVSISVASIAAYERVD